MTSAFIMGLQNCHKPSLRYFGLMAVVAIIVLLTRDFVFLCKSVMVQSASKTDVTGRTRHRYGYMVLNATMNNLNAKLNLTKDIHPNHFDSYYSHTSPYIVPPDPIDEFDKAEEPPFIPHIIHQTWDRRRVPKSFEKWIQSWVKVHPTWEFWFWTPEEVRLLLKLHYPQYLAQYDALKLNLHRANAMRFFIMYHFGGVYADLDLEAIKPLDPWTYKVHCLLPEETLAHPYLLHNRDRPNTMITLLACRPGHPYFQLAIDRLPLYPNLTNPEKVLFVDSVYEEYNATKTAHSSPENYMVLGHPEYFLPTFDVGWKAKFQSLCHKRKLPERSANQLYVCDKLAKSHYINKILPHSYTDHHWFHVVMRSEQWKEQNTAHIDSLIPFNTNITERLLKESNSTQELLIRV